jgi:hypothetical protein
MGLPIGFSRSHRHPAHAQTPAKKERPSQNLKPEKREPETA